MIEKFLICTDLDRTLIPNGPEPESPQAPARFASLVNRKEVLLTYVSGRDRVLVEQAISSFSLPQPDYVIGDVGTSIYEVGKNAGWQHQIQWEQEIADDWNGLAHADLQALLADLSDLQLQEHARQNRFKLSYYLPLNAEQHALEEIIQSRFIEKHINARLVWSVDEPAGVGLLDVLPHGASKLHAIEALIRMKDFNLENTVFCGDSGNDLEVLESPIKAVLVANAQDEVRQESLKRAHSMGNAEQLFCAQGTLLNMNGNYSGGMLEGIAHYFPETIRWMDDNE